MANITKIIIELEDGDHILALEQVKELYKELRDLFEDKDCVYYPIITPQTPAYPWITYY